MLPNEILLKKSNLFIKLTTSFQYEVKRMTVEGCSTLNGIDLYVLYTY